MAEEQQQKEKYFYSLRCRLCEFRKRIKEVADNFRVSSFEMENGLFFLIHLRSSVEGR